jgi:hypothetical protein
MDRFALRRQADKADIATAIGCEVGFVYLILVETLSKPRRALT